LLPRNSLHYKFTIMRITFLVTFLSLALVNGLPFPSQTDNKVGTNSLETRNPPEAKLTHTFNTHSFEPTNEYKFNLHGQGWDYEGLKTKLQVSLTRHRNTLRRKTTYLTGHFTGSKTGNDWNIGFTVKLEEGEKFDDVKDIVVTVVKAAFSKAGGDGETVEAVPEYFKDADHSVPAEKTSET